MHFYNKVNLALWWGKWKERDHMEQRGLDGRIIPKQILKKSAWRTCTELIWLRI
jgi:hypothetical protein